MDRIDQYQDTRERILAIGQELIVGRGFSAIGLNEILTRAEVPKGSFYHYFQSKEGFGVALLERYFDDYHARSALLFCNESISSRERLLAYFGNWRKVADNSQCQVMCLAIKLAAEVADLSEPMRIALSKGMTRIIEQIAQVLEQAQAEGSLSKQLDAAQLAESLYGMWVGASLLTKVNHDIKAMDLAYKQTQQMLQPLQPLQTP
ncbi:TetR/AcrR family transcriptional regulator [Undibacterium sp. RTI2.1]|uniref:TetR/AcrR family transcriptional regulator n=1 Tax=unclassified Undibacterium TaxID=2630295 RepID=UPI002AB4F54A|nr:MULTISPECIES: TetR/AcrR family transcriptional regulator [unclassified Undibacterium]MDY7536722.1 TetR/AcrR family transcriptional regulator [Undibacterium sp. 5I1]MEB0032087.1 TetR/AcrR family transcriptional regulator [Undibacterium sp. RTI2.1]MEB0118334.1 TetR/AcrR family transcriptional regulator [Undibacterium sp. RTI2.2]MEB0230233.1 TetR/AcrR family transcriptional regulator [Undibacterium sp. 10I3]MEB0257933.1 TetR/AcrR family transcriptional regulator [Undibacterium sp. 5I1]